MLLACHKKDIRNKKKCNSEVSAITIRQDDNASILRFQALGLKRYMNPRGTIPNTYLNVTKRFVTFLLIILNVFRFCYSLRKFRSPASANHVYPVDHVAPVFRASSYGLALVLQALNKEKGNANSGVLFLFWFLAAICGVFEFQTALRSLPLDPENDQALFAFIISMIAYPLVLIEFIFAFFTDPIIRESLPGEDPRERRLSQQANKPCPEETASLPSKLTFQWVWPLVVLGHKKPLEFTDLWTLNSEDQANTVVDQFNKYFKPAFEKCQQYNKKLASIQEATPEGPTDGLLSRNRNPKAKKKIASILPAMCKANWGLYTVGSILKLFQDILMFVSPQLLDLLIQHVNSDEHVWKGYFYALLMLVTTITQTILLGQYFIRMQVVGMRTRSALVSAIYQKSLVISNAARRESTTGEIVNLMSVDSQRFLDLITYVNAIWSSPLQIAIALYFLWNILGPSVLAGVAVLVLLIPFNIVTSNMREKLQVKQMENKDQRVKLMNEILSGIKVLKLYAWEPSFEKEVKEIRRKELRVLKTEAYLDSFNEFLWYSAPFVVTLVTFATYVLIDDKNILDARKAFVALALFNILRMPMSFLPWIIVLIVQAGVSLKRLNKFLNADEIDQTSVTHEDNGDDISIEIQNGTFRWDDTPTLKNINFQVPKGSLVAVVGVVGSGKSSLLAGILGEMEKLVGSVNTVGSIAYVAQQAWIQNETLRGNILFGRKYDVNKYEQILDACALHPDLAILPGGDKTEIGEKGINLSGGQKQRVSLARATYNDADVYLLDDPLSAVDSHVGKHIFDRVVGKHGLLRDKTRVIVTHGLTYLPQMDCIVVMNDGEISEVGTFQQLLDKKGAFAEFLIQYLSLEDLEGEDNEVLAELELVAELKEEARKRQRLHSRNSRNSENEADASLTKTTTVNLSQKQQLANEAKGNLTPSQKLIEVEKAEIGSVKRSVYLHYMKSIGWGIVTLSLVFHFILHGLTLSSSIWLSMWAAEPAVNGTQNIAKRNLYLSVYGGLGIGQAVAVFVATLSMAIGSLRAAKFLHNQMLRNILCSPMWFFDTTPLGRIVNRFSKDVDVADTTFPANLRTWLNCLFEVVSTFVIISYSTPWFVAVVVPIGILYLLIQRFYVSSSRQLKRLESVSRSPVFSHFSETLTGATTIRAFSVQNQFIDESLRTVDSNQMAYFPSICANRWLAIRLEGLGNCIAFFAALFAVISHPSAGFVGLSIAYALNITDTFNWLMRIASDVETNVVAIERIKEYGETPQEAAWEVPETKPPRNWPSRGTIKFSNYHSRYREGLDLVLRGINCDINSGEKVGIVGRTGAGKSSMTLGLFRIVEAAEGSIQIDGEGGENLSVGQRQLVCLARALLRKTKILILDEATAAVDLETDDLIQQTIRSEFDDCTVLTIAHRLNTIMDYNRVIVLDKGKIREYDSPYALMEDEGTIFYSMAKDAGLVKC
ncbi:unnamed protein product [Allacma fusca]|uniref:ABC-type glutathione-S-conjugate transporter n=1 Tax=Allacma fusca TaxID=39272 RepID=A0A8J2P187_9HEXA|nr:unnamed protein product [Allacma fusca]